jgi:uncharacterized protein YlzI (FlbEa/FlbD family)
MNMEFETYSDHIYQYFKDIFHEEERILLDDTFPELEQAGNNFFSTTMEENNMELLPEPQQGAQQAPEMYFPFNLGFLNGESQSSGTSSECWSPINSSCAYNDENIAEACFKSERFNSWPQIKQEISTKEELATTSTIVATFYLCRDNLAPNMNAKPHITASKPKSAPVVIKKQKKQSTASSVLSRVTIEQAFMCEPTVQVDNGYRYFLLSEAESVAERVFAHQRKISKAGRKSKGKSSERTAYTRMHDALKKAGWKRQIIGEFYYYQK